jgi:hypothetical protein
VSTGVRFDPYAVFDALERHRVSYVVVGAFARVVHGSGEVTKGLDIVPSLRDENLRRMTRAFDELAGSSTASLQADVLSAGEPVTVRTAAGAVTLVPQPWGTRGYDDIRIRGNRENLGRGVRPQIASLVDLTRMLEASRRREDAERLQRLRRLMELERQLSRGPRLER